MRSPVKTLLIISFLLPLSLGIAAEKGGNDGSDLLEIIEQYKMTRMCPLEPERYCKNIDDTDPELTDFWQACCQAESQN